MKKLNFTTLLAAFALIFVASCSQVDDLDDFQVSNEKNVSNAITFGTYLGRTAQTRAGYQGAINTDVLKNSASKGFGVFAYYTGTKTYAEATNHPATGTQTTKAADFMFNQQVQWEDASSAWTYSPIKYWPNEVAADDVDDQDNDQNNDPAKTDSYQNGGNVSFFAYAPYVGADQLTDDYGITKINGQKSITNQSEKKSDPIITYVLDPNSEKAVDLLWGTKGINTSVNVNNAGNTGVKGDPAGTTDYQKAIREGYWVNADLTKQKTNGRIDFAFKHALSKVGGSFTTTDTTIKGDDEKNETPTNGLMVILDIDKDGAESGGLLESYTGGTDVEGTPYNTKVTINEIKIECDKQVSSDGKIAQKNGSYKSTENGHTEKLTSKGDFNLATGQWTDLEKLTSTTITHTISNNESNVYNETNHPTGTASGALSKNLAEPTTPPAHTKAGFEELPIGVTNVAKNVYETDVAPFVFIPGTRPVMDVTIEYTVRTYDKNLTKSYTEVKQRIKKTLSFGSDVELNKQYNILIHLGLTSVKFSASVDNWDVTPLEDKGKDITDDNNIQHEVSIYEDDVEHVYLPINVADAAAAVQAANAFKYTNPTTGNVAYTYHGNITVDGATVNYTIDKSNAATPTDGTTNVVADLARFLGALWRQDSGTTVQEITYDGNSYIWDSTLNLKGSNWKEKGSEDNTKTLVKAISSNTDLRNLLTTAGTATLTFYINGLTDDDHTITLNVKTTETTTP